ncbi:hypothetical protein [Chitinophaga skermanii]|nr:hypothetical protein [Chitinophaga skermanii]
MNFFKKLFRRKHQNPASLSIDEGVHVFKKTDLPTYKYSHLPEHEFLAINMCIDFLQNGLPQLLKFEKSPANHPANLDEYVEVWKRNAHKTFLGIDADQHLLILAYNFGQYLVDTYGFKWEKRLQGNAATLVVRTFSPVEIEMYPLDTTMKAVHDDDPNVFANVEQKLKRALGKLF